jgi:hypothetical protein
MANSAKSVDEQPDVYFAVPLSRLFLFSFISLGLYQLYWFYRNWTIIRDKNGEDIRPFWRTVFNIFYCYGLFRRVSESAREREYAGSYSAGLVAAAFIILSFLGSISGQSEAVTVPMIIGAELLSVLSIVPLLTVQRAINYNNSRVDEHYDPEPKLRQGEIYVTILGVCFFVMILLAWVSKLSG